MISSQRHVLWRTILSLYVQRELSFSVFAQFSSTLVPSFQVFLTRVHDVSYVCPSDFELLQLFVEWHTVRLNCLGWACGPRRSKKNGRNAVQQ